jgi:hypothetical protein
MGISKQIGWGTESNILYEILKELKRLKSTIFGIKPKYKVYTALLTQSGTNDPVATVLENTIGTLDLFYDDDGLYYIESSSLFTPDKTLIFFGTPTDGDYASIYQINCVVLSEDLIIIRTFMSGNSSDGLLTNTPIEIRVYN